MAELRTAALEHRGVQLEGRIAMPHGPGPHPAVMVMYNAHGLGPQVCEAAARLARLGYVALVTDMYGGGAYYEDQEGAGEALAPLWADPQLLRSRVVAWYDHLKARPEVDASRVAAIGYCFGGQCVLELARSGADARIVVSYHGILTTAKPAEPGAVRAYVAVYTGAKDPYAPREQVIAFENEMRAADAHWQITVFGDAYHSFTSSQQAPEPEKGLAYDPIADKVSWAGTLTLLEALV